MDKSRVTWLSCLVSWVEQSISSNFSPALSALPSLSHLLAPITVALSTPHYRVRTPHLHTLSHTSRTQWLSFFVGHIVTEHSLLTMLPLYCTY